MIASRLGQLEYLRDFLFESLIASKTLVLIHFYNYYCSLHGCGTFLLQIGKKLVPFGGTRFGRLCPQIRSIGDLTRLESFTTKA